MGIRGFGRYWGEGKRKNRLSQKNKVGRIKVLSMMTCLQGVWNSIRSWLSKTPSLCKLCWRTVIGYESVKLAYFIQFSAEGGQGGNKFKVREKARCGRATNLKLKMSWLNLKLEKRQDVAALCLYLIFCSPPASFHCYCLGKRRKVTAFKSLIQHRLLNT